MRLSRPQADPLPIVVAVSRVMAVRSVQPADPSGNSNQGHGFRPACAVAETQDAGRAAVVLKPAGHLVRG